MSEASAAVTSKPKNRKYVPEWKSQDETTLVGRLLRVERPEHARGGCTVRPLFVSEYVARYRVTYRGAGGATNSSFYVIVRWSYTEPRVADEAGELQDQVSWEPEFLEIRMERPVRGFAR